MRKSILVLVSLLLVSFNAVAQDICGPTANYKERIDLGAQGTLFRMPGIYTNTSMILFSGCFEGNCSAEPQIDKVCSEYLAMTKGVSATKKANNSGLTTLEFLYGDKSAINAARFYISDIICK